MQKEGAIPLLLAPFLGLPVLNECPFLRWRLLMYNVGKYVLSTTMWAGAGVDFIPALVYMCYFSLFSVRYFMNEETAFTCSSLRVSIDSKTCFFAREMP